MEGAAEMMEQVKQASQAKYVQELVGKLSDICFDKCVKKPRYSLDSSQQTCISNCMDTFLEAMNAISEVAVKTMEDEAKKVCL